MYEGCLATRKRLDEDELHITFSVYLNEPCMRLRYELRLFCQLSWSCEGASSVSATLPAPGGFLGFFFFLLLAFDAIDVCGPVGVPVTELLTSSGLLEASMRSRKVKLATKSRTVSCKSVICKLT